MHVGVGRVDELPRDKGTGRLLRKFLCAGDGTRHAACPLGQHQLGTERAQNLPPLDRHGVGHHDDEAIAAGGGNGCEPDARIPGGRLDDDGILRQDPARLGVIQHGACHAVLDRSRWVQTLRFGEERETEPQFFFDIGEPHERRIADETVDGSVDFAHNESFSLFL